MKTSYSALNTYKTCPLKYKYSQIDKIREPKSIEAVFGTLVHSALKFMFERNPLYPTLDEVINLYRNKWYEKSEKINWKDESKKEEQSKLYFEDGVKLIKSFYKKNQPWTFDVVELEGRFSIDLEDETTGRTHTLSGIIDRIDKDPDSEVYEIIDYKTGKRMPAEKDLETDLQLGVYHLALTKRWPSIKEGNIVTSLYFLKHGEKISSTPTKSVINELKKSVLETIRDIEVRTENNDFPPTPGPLCNFCGFRNICPMWSHEYIKPEDKKSEEEIQRVIRDFFEIKNNADDNKKRMAELRAEILIYMEQNKVLRVFGDDGYITKTAMQKISYNEDKLKEILGDTEYWKQILAPDSSKIKNIISQLPAELKEKVKQAEEGASTTTLKATKKKVLEDAEMNEL